MADLYISCVEIVRDTAIVRLSNGDTLQGLTSVDSSIAAKSIAKVKIEAFVMKTPKDGGLSELPRREVV